MEDFGMPFALNKGAGKKNQRKFLKRRKHHVQ